MPEGDDSDNEIATFGQCRYEGQRRLVRWLDQLNGEGKLSVVTDLTEQSEGGREAGVDEKIIIFADTNGHFPDFQGKELIKVHPKTGDWVSYFNWIDTRWFEYLPLSPLTNLYLGYEPLLAKYWIKDLSSKGISRFGLVFGWLWSPGSYLLQMPEDHRWDKGEIYLSCLPAPSPSASDPTEQAFWVSLLRKIGVRW